MKRLRATVVTMLILGGCKASGPAPFTQGQRLGGQEVSAASLNRGRVVYTQYCRACHGDGGEGNGPASAGLRPPPRNFTRGVFKFGSTLPRDGAPTLPRDEDFQRIIRGGLHGSAMLAWDIPDPELQDLIQYLKTFSPKWKEEVPGEPLVASADPWAARDAEGVAQGKRLYHGLAQCSSCHPAYATKVEIAEAVRALNPGAEPSFRADLYMPSAVDSIEYSVDGQRPLKIMPPDFVRRSLKSVRPEHALADLYRVVSLGINGAGMPPWRDTLTEEQIWAIAHYVRSLSDLRGTPEADALEKRLASANVAGPKESGAK